MRKYAIALVLSFLALAATGEVAFGGLDLSSSGYALFLAEADMPGDAPYDTLFRAELETQALRQMTFYPELVTLVDSSRQLQIQNRFGIFRTDSELANVRSVEGFPSFERGGRVQTGKLVPGMASPNGAYIAHVVPTSWAYGRLVILDVEKKVETVIAENIEYSLDYPPVRWAPDSKFFIYVKNANVYYYSIEQYVGKRIIDEAFRLIGPGHVKSCSWSANGSLYYLKGTQLYRVMPAEFFTITLYAGLLSPGTMVGKIPYAFDPNFDAFWISPDGAKILFCKDGRNVFVYYLDPDDFGKPAKVSSLPYMYLQGNTSILSIVWPANDVLTVFTASYTNGSRTTGAYRVSIPKAIDALPLVQAFVPLDTGNATEIAPSPDGSKIALSGPDGVSLRNYIDWKEGQKLSSGPVLHTLWVSETKVIVAGKATIELWSLADGSRRLIALSQASSAGWAGDGSGIVASIGSTSYKTDAAKLAWARADGYPVQAATSSSDTWRVYVDELSSGPYANAVMVRSLKALGTVTLFPTWQSTYPAFPDRDEANGSGVFAHGSRLRRREVALVFDAIDTTEGLVDALNTLEDYGIRATFFVNGEFMRRNPGATRLIAESGHEIGSMFFTSFNPTDARFSFDPDFIRRGLARNEDDYFKTTGHELSLLWHVPYYTINADVADAGASMNYLYIGRDLDPMDWVSVEQGYRLPGSYMSSHRIVEKVMREKKPGSIIPVRIGVQDEERADYLFNDISLLINALMGEGFSIVPVSTLIEHAK